MYEKLICVALATFTFTPISARAETTPETLVRTSKWDLSYDENGCDLAATFGSGSGQIAVKFTTLAPRDHLRIMFLGDRLQSDKMVTPVKVSFGSGDAREFSGIFANSGNAPALLVSLNGLALPLDPAPASRNGPVEQEAMTISVQKMRPFSLATNKFSAALQQLHRCTDNVVREWGYDPAEQAALLHGPKPLDDPSQWFRGTAGYPRFALIAGEGGIVSFRLDITEDGNVAGCTILRKSSVKEFAELTCKRLQEKARFSPAVGADGKPVRSFFVNSINWTLNVP